MQRIFVSLLLLFFFQGFSQIKKKTKVQHIAKLDLLKLNDSVAALFPVKVNGKFGFQNQKGKVVIKPVYSNVGFFAEDCNLLNSPNEKIRKFGTKSYASVRAEDVDYRIDMYGKRVYEFKKEDLGKCPSEYRKQLFHGYVKKGFYGLIEDSKFSNPEDFRHYRIYPQYEYLHVLEGDDLKNPMIIASRGNRFGVIDVNNRIIIPFEYSDIKRNYSWKLGRLFEVTKDGTNYFYIDDKNKRY